MAFITAETRSDLIELSVAMLKQAPSNTLLEELIALSVGGGSLADAADHIAKTDAFKAEYPSFQTAEQYAAEIFDNITTGGTVTADIRTAVIELATGMLTSGSVTKAGLALAMAEYLAAPAALLNEDFADIAQSFQNRADAAEYFVVTKELGGSTDAELAAAIASVTSDAATLTTANTAADATADAEEVVPGQTFTLTTGVDAIVGDADDSTITASAGTFGTGDTIAAGAGTDTLNVTLTGAGPTQSATSMTGVEVLNITASPNPATLNLTGVTGLTEVNNASSANGATLAVTGLGNAVDTTITGTNTSTTIGYSTAVTAATALTDAATLTLAGTNLGSSFVTAGIESLTVDSTTSANVLSALTATGVGSVTLTGDQDLTVSGTVGGTSLTTLDASAATGAITIATGSGTSSATDVTGITVSAPTSADAGLFTVTTGSNKDVVTLGGGDAVVATGAGADTITATAGANTITPGTGNDSITLGAGVDTVRFAEAGATNADNITSMGTDDVLAINLGAAAVAGVSAASANATFGTVQTGGTSPVLSNVAGTGTGTAIAFQAISPNATATVGTVAGTSNVIALEGAYTDGTATGVITALGTSATTGIATTATGKFLLVTYSVGNIAQVWAFTGDSTLDTNITAGELSLVATLDGIAQNSLTADNFAAYLTPAVAAASVSNTGQAIELSGALNTVQATANDAGQFLTAANDTITLNTGSLPIGARSATQGLTIIDPSAADADTLSASNLGAATFSGGGIVISNIETINLDMLVANTTFSAAAVTPGTSQFGLTGTQDFVVTAMPNGGGVTLGSGYTGAATFGLVSDAGAADSVRINLAGSTATSATVGASVVYTGDATESAVVNVSADSSIRMSTAAGDTGDLFAAAGDITATTLRGSGDLTIFGTGTTLDTLNLNGDAVNYTGTLTVRPTDDVAMDFSVATGGAGLVTGIDVVNLSSIPTYSSLITLDSANSSAGAATTISFSPIAAGALGNFSVAQEGSGLSDTINLSMGALATAAGNIAATSIEEFNVISTRTTGVTLGNITLTDGVGTQTVSVRAAAVGAGTITADSVDFSGVLSTVTGVTLANTAGATFQGGAGNTTVAGSAAADVINTGIGDDVITGNGGDDIINAGAGTNSITGGAGSDLLSGGAGVDTYPMVVADVGDTITNFSVAADIIDWNTTLVAIDGGADVSFQSAAAGTAIAAGTSVFELTGVTTGGTAANLVTALGATATNADIDAADNILIVNYLTGGGAQIWNLIDANGADVDAGELTLVATLTGVVADSMVTGNFI